MLPIVSAADDAVWDTLVRQLPEYVRKRLDNQLRSARMDLELSGPDTRSVEVVRATVALVRHVLHILSTLLGLVHRRAAQVAREMIAPAAMASGAASPAVGTPMTPQRGGGGAAAGGDGDGGASDDSKQEGSKLVAGDGGAASDVDTPTDKGPAAAWSESEGGGKDGELGRDGIGEAWESEREGEVEGAAAAGESSVEQDKHRQLAQNISELERARMSVNLLRTLVQAELGMWEVGG
jgi:hypothetical protein